MKSGFSFVIVKGNDQARNFSQQLAIDADKGPPMAPVMRKPAALAALGMSSPSSQEA